MCPSRHLLARLGEKWTVLAITDLAGGPVRFGQLLRRLEGVSQKMLTQTLRNLERDGLISRAVVNDRPIQVSYALTPMGQDLLPVVAALTEWTRSHYVLVEAQQQLYDRQQAHPRA